MNYQKEIKKPTEIEMMRAARQYLIDAGHYVHGRRGRTDGPRRCSNNTPVIFVDGSSRPSLQGLPYWKIYFCKGNFKKVIYTPSTLHVVVGRSWPGLHRTDETAKERTRRAARIYAWVARIQVTAEDFLAHGACEEGVRSWCTAHGVADSATMPLGPLLRAGGQAAQYALRIAEAIYRRRKAVAV